MATDIKEILEGYGLTDEQVSTISAKVVENYRSIAEVTKKDKRIEELTDQVDDLNQKIEEAAESGQKVDELQAVVDEFRAKEEERKQAAEEQARRDSFTAVFDSAIGDREFANDLMRETVFEKAYSMCQGDAGIGAKDAIESVTKDVEGVWVNPQHDPKRMPGADLTGNQQTKATSKRAFANLLFGSGQE